MPAPDLSITTWALVGASVTSGYVLWSNTALYQMGLMPLFNGRLGSDKNIQISTRNKVKAWRAYYDSASRWVVGSVVVGASMSIFTFAKHPSEMVGRLALASAIDGLLVVPFTLLFIMPTNKELFALEESDAVSDEASAPAKRANELLQKWERLHRWRFLTYISSFMTAMAALVYDGRV